MQVTQRRTVLIGLIGDGIGASGSPLLHECEALAHDVNLIYRLCDFARLGLGAQDLGEVVRNAQRLGFNGFNVTHPYKAAIIPLLDELSADAKAIGAVNTFVIRNGRLTGFNTDWSGFAQGMRVGLPGVKLDYVTQIGAGGAGSATAYAILTLGARRLSIYDVQIARAEQLMDKLKALFPDRTISATADVAAAVAESDGIIQATPIGMVGHPGMPIDPTLLRSELWVSDVIYTPRETELLMHARQRGCRTLNGAGMVVYQAMGAFRIFTGLEPDATRMMNTLLAQDARK